MDATEILALIQVFISAIIMIAVLYVTSKQRDTSEEIKKLIDQAKEELKEHSNEHKWIVWEN